MRLMSTSWSNAVQRAVTRIGSNDRGGGVRTVPTSTLAPHSVTAPGVDATYAHLAHARSTLLPHEAKPTDSPLSDRQTLTLRILQDVFGMPGPEVYSSPRARIPSVPEHKAPAPLPNLGDILRVWATTRAGQDPAAPQQTSAE